MKYKIKDEKYSFISVFDTETGAYIRTGIIDEDGRDNKWEEEEENVN